MLNNTSKLLILRLNYIGSLRWKEIKAYYCNINNTNYAIDRPW